MFNNKIKLNSISKKIIKLSTKVYVNQYHVDQITNLLGQAKDIDIEGHNSICQHILIKPLLKSIGYI